MIMNAKEQEKLLQALEARFEKNMHRHSGIAWAKVRAKLEGNPDALRSLREMEATGGEPDVIGQDRAASSSSATVPRRVRRAAEVLLRR